jgi:hypothetical protein
MRIGARRISPSMVVSLTALVVALGGSALAATGSFQSSSGTVQGCIAQANVVSTLTGGVDAITNGQLSPVVGAVNSAVSSVDSAAQGAVSSAPNVIMPKGAVFVVAPGATCPDGTAPQTFAAATAAQLPEVFSAHESSPRTLGASDTIVAATALPAGDYLVSATADVNDTGGAAAQTIECGLVSPTGREISGTAETVSVPAQSGASDVALPITAVVTVGVTGVLKLDCADRPPSTRSAIFRAAGITPQQCGAGGGQPGGGTCHGGFYSGTNVTAAPAKPAAKATGTIVATPARKFTLACASGPTSNASCPG